MSAAFTTCPECRRERPGQRRFCRYCGAPMGVKAAPPSAPPRPVAFAPPPPRAAPPKSRGRGGAWLAAAAVVVVLLAALVFWAAGTGTRTAWDPHLQLVASPAEIAPGSQVVVSWSAVGAETLMLNGEMVPSVGSRTVSLKRTTLFQITAFSRDGRSQSREVTVQVAGPGNE